MTTRRTHAVVAKKVINNDNGGQPLVCCWDECDRLGLEMYKHTMCEHAVGANCEYEDRIRIERAGRTAHLNFVFCSWRHRAYWVNATGVNAHISIANTGRAYGNLPVGMRHRDQVG